MSLNKNILFSQLIATPFISALALVDKGENNGNCSDSENSTEKKV